MFERNMRDEFFVSSPAKLGEMASCKVWIENPGMGDNWHLDHVLLTHLPSQREWRFNCRDWVPKGAGPAQGKMLPASVSRDVPLQGPPPGADTSAVDQDAAAAGPPKPPPRPLVQYEVTVATGDKFGAGTDALTSIELVGSRGSAKHTFDQSKSLFERGSRDRFRLTLPDVGNITAVRAWHDGSGFGADWYLDGVTIEHPLAGCKWEASFAAWMKGGETNGLTKPTRQVAGSPADAEKVYDAAMAAAAAKEAERQAAIARQDAATRPPKPPPGASDTAAAPDRFAKKPGDEGIAKQVRAPAQQVKNQKTTRVRSWLKTRWPRPRSAHHGARVQSPQDHGIVPRPPSCPQALLVPGRIASCPHPYPTPPHTLTARSPQRYRPAQPPHYPPPPHRHRRCSSRTSSRGCPRCSRVTPSTASATRCATTRSRRRRRGRSTRRRTRRTPSTW